MRHVLLFRTVKTSFLDFCIEAVRRRFPRVHLTLVARCDTPLPTLEDRVDAVIEVGRGMIPMPNVPGMAWREMRRLRPDIVVIPVNNPSLWFYREAYRVALETGAARVLGLSLDGAFFRLHRPRFYMRRFLDFHPVGLAASLLLLPYAGWLLTTGWVGYRLSRSLTLRGPDLDD